MTQSKVATDGKLFFVGTWDNSFRAIDAVTGKEAWQQKFGKSRSGDYNFYFAPAIGSHALLLQMTTNLLHNAIVHNLLGRGTVWITTSVHPQTVVLTVENTGEQLSAQLVSTLTEPFQRGAERVRGDHAGVGLGLAIVKSIAQAHDGTLTLTPRAAGGLCVTVQLPAAPPDAREE